MPRKKRDARYLNLYIATDVADMVDVFSKETGIPKSRIVENAVREYMKNHVVSNPDGERYVVETSVQKYDTGKEEKS